MKYFRDETLVLLVQIFDGTARNAERNVSSDVHAHFVEAHRNSATTLLRVLLGREATEEEINKASCTERE